MIFPAILSFFQAESEPWPMHWHLVMATEAGGTHPTGMHSCLNIGRTMCHASWQLQDGRVLVSWHILSQPLQVCWIALPPERPLKWNKVVTSLHQQISVHQLGHNTRFQFWKQHPFAHCQWVGCVGVLSGVLMHGHTFPSNTMCYPVAFSKSKI